MQIGRQMAEYSFFYYVFIINIDQLIVFIFKHVLIKKRKTR